jgi:hypothetical protein
MPNAAAAWVSQEFDDWNAISDAGSDRRSTAS